MSALPSANHAPPTAGRPAGPSAAALGRLDESLIRLRRLLVKPALYRQAGPDTGCGADLSQVLVVDAVHRGQAEHAEVTVGVVAERLDVDHSTASRLVAGAIRAGYLTRATSARDARCAHLELTAEGRQLLERAAGFRMAYLHRLVEDWPAEDVQRLADLLARLAEAAARKPARRSSAPAHPSP